MKMSENVDHVEPSCYPSTSDSASMQSSPPSLTQAQIAPSINQSIMRLDLETKGGREELRVRCHLCNEELLLSSFVDLPCSHRFCNRCASMNGGTQLCPLCLNEFAASTVCDLMPSRSTVVYPDRRPEISNISVDTAFSIWNPLLPKSQKFDVARNTHSSPPPPPVFSPSSPAVDAVGCLPTPPLFPAPSSINWNTAPTVSIRSPMDFSYLKCSMCAEEGARASVRCEQCQETLCSDCVLAHYRVRVTRDHHLSPIETFKNLTLSQPPVLPDRAKFDEAPNGEACPIHDAPLVCVCKTCANSSLCHLCVTDHSKHHLIPHGDLRSAVLILIAETKHDQKNLEDSLETVRGMTERVDASVQAVVRELCSEIHMHIGALEERKRDLLHRVDTIHQTKIQTLKAQSERIAQRLACLSDTVKLAELAASSSDGTDVALRSSFDTLMNILREPAVYLPPNETDLIKFIPPDTSLITRVRNIGELVSGACARTSHIIGEGYRRAIRDRLCSIFVQTRDACGYACTSFAHTLTAVLSGPDSQSVQVQLIERETGVYCLNYVPVQEGNHVLDILIRGVSISGCPTTIRVRKGRNYSSMVRTGPLFSFGSEGSGDGQLCRPWGICCDNKGRILVADRSNNRIQIFNKDGNFLFKFGSAGSRPGQFDRPAGIAVNSMNDIIIADKDNHRVQVFSEVGEFLFKFGERGRVPGMFNYPWGVAVNSFNQIAVSDTRNHRVQIFSPQGQYIRKCGFETSLFYKNLDSPRGVCYLHDGQLIITDFNNHRLAVVSRGTSEMKCFGSEGESEGFFCRPQGVTTDNEGHILVCDSRNNRIQVLNADDMHCVAAFGGIRNQPGTADSTNNTFGAAQSSMSTSGASPSLTDTLTTSPENHALLDASSTSSLDRPTDLCVSPDGLIYVVDFGNNCIRVY
ncbi:hypothetical protein AB6A40_000732 [Gnathostoma spinigerum]|uniref:Uncharacterized protein n=1 Tax=Gnathostoma spinigerum TaxID=75299 RepID=A0ABD6EB81_9BILA